MVGARPTLESAAQELGLKTAHLDEFTTALGKDVGSVSVRVVADADQDVTDAVLEVRATASEQTEQQLQDAAAADAELGRHLSTVRAVKDAWEVEQMQLAVDSTATAFDAVVAALPQAVEKGRGERWIEGTLACTLAIPATESAMTRSVLLATTPTPCTGSATPAMSPREISC
ncbi:hypothetical protein [Ornithinimicrobium sp. INDO-MA30-4]|uniref:hypothetical protein n=1 Tax=Ornithinimicrobium sp. INDO-MA30-4 TaxID=2908651 RepID=UPI0037C6CE09